LLCSVRQDLRALELFEGIQLILQIKLFETQEMVTHSLALLINSTEAGNLLRGQEMVTNYVFFFFPLSGLHSSLDAKNSAFQLKV
jgi:hypothetical protein